ncbi:MAG: PIN domain-containing protein [Akkermansiaceae bacterium]
MKTVKPSLVFNSLLRLEVENSIRLCVAHKRMNEKEAQLSRNRIEQFEKSSQWVDANVEWERAFARALGLSKSHTSNIYSRSLDILHVACAMELGCRHFWSFDKKQRNLAEIAGLRLNPLD